MVGSSKGPRPHEDGNSRHSLVASIHGISITEKESARSSLASKLKHESCGTRPHTPHSRAPKGRLWPSRDASTDTSDSDSSDETVVCTRRCHQHRAFSRFEKEKEQQKFAIEQTCRPPLDRIPIVRQPLAVTASEFNPVCREDGRLVRSLWRHARDAVERPKDTPPFQWTPRGQSCQRSRSCPPVRPHATCSRSGKFESAVREADTSRSKSRRESRSSRRGSASERDDSLLTVNIGRSRAPEYIRHDSSYGVDGPGYETLHKGMLQDTGMTYTRQYELPTISRFLNAKHPIFLRARSGSFVAKKETRRRPSPPSSESSSSESEESVSEDEVVREKVTNAPEAPYGAVVPPPAVGPTCACGCPEATPRGQQEARPSVVVSPSMGPPVLLVPAQANPVPGFAQQPPLHLPTRHSTQPPVARHEDFSNRATARRQHMTGGELPIDTGGYGNSYELNWDSGRFTQHLVGAQPHPSRASVAPLGVPIPHALPTRASIGATPYATLHSSRDYSCTFCPTANIAGGTARSRVINSQRQEVPQPMLVDAAPAACVSSNAGNCDFTLTVNGSAVLSTRPPAGQPRRTAGGALKTPRPSMTPAVQRSDLFCSCSPTFQQPDRTECMTTRASAAPRSRILRAPVCDHPKPRAVPFYGQSQSTPIEAEIFITPPVKEPGFAHSPPRLNCAPAGRDRSASTRSILKNACGPSRDVPANCQPRVTLSNPPESVRFIQEPAENVCSHDGRAVTTVPTASDQRVLCGRPLMYQVASPWTGHAQTIQGILNPNPVVCVGSGPNFPPHAGVSQY
ncbi:conserved hypothetical protein [Neospora caninum Liverpool]|uniref:Uncharacterized protein n=1 Tax=Neospora caninum (strain Liverpool) TaxID=572307 RepID=F0VA64_NEOCL|nr:conserved hypothetical protein [Neospora caninum Liverpool]CBZ50553.1 conserved hypothetical protein [Neospora caninum Liverpool]CEL65163.1 TPA: hypothetical protein BN1204_010220 [Neospora caninum Liverpool]|eukprot:XP_003880586.1 conserved hypothetical protein [Neospora caninum Liverpool]